MIPKITGASYIDFSAWTWGRIGDGGFGFGIGCVQGGGCCMHFYYTLVMTNIAIEAMAQSKSWIYPLKMVDLSIVMLTYQRVSSICFCHLDTLMVSTELSRAAVWLKKCETEY